MAFKGCIIFHYVGIHINVCIGATVVLTNFLGLPTEFVHKISL